MKLYLAKPDITFFEQYKDMMKEWHSSGSHIAPWFLSKSVTSFDEFCKFIRMLDDCEHGIVDKRFSSTTSYFVVNNYGKLIGATSLRHYLTLEGFQTWGHIGYGVRPSERSKGYATQMLKMTIDQAREKKIYKLLLSAYEQNIASCKIIEKCGGILENKVYIKNKNEPIFRYSINA